MRTKSGVLLWRLCSWLAILAWEANPSGAEERQVQVGTIRQEVARHAERQSGLPSADVLNVACDAHGVLVTTTAGQVRRDGDRWVPVADATGAGTAAAPKDLPANTRQWAQRCDGTQAAATADGLFERPAQGAWHRLQVDDGQGRLWAARDVLGVTYDARDELWFATRAGVGQRTTAGWRFLEGRDGLPYNDFTCCAAGADGSVWFGTHRGAIRYQDGQWAYRQGLRWLPHDDVRAIAVEPDGTAWLATAQGVGCIERRPMTLADKAEYYEDEISKYIKRTPFGYTAEVSLPRPGERSQVVQSDSDNDGLWTAMYGAGQCFAFAATGSPESRQRAQQAFEALRFLQVVTQGSHPSPPHGFVARTILPTSGPDPNLGRLEQDRLTRIDGDRLWKVYEPRWPKSADGQWYWKSDTSSDELDGHFFFYPLYYDLVADTDAERERVRTVVRDLADHLIRHDFVLQDHDGQPTRWAVYRPKVLNRDLNWSAERGLNSLSIVTYMTVAAHITGEQRYRDALQHLIEEHGYHLNIMVPKTQRGIGSGNQSDDEMAFMSFYSLLKYTKSPELRRHFLTAFYAYWMLEQPERNPFFHFAYASAGLGESHQDEFDEHALSPWDGWLTDSVATLTDFPLDRCDWGHQNSHRIDLVHLPRQHGGGSLELNEDGERGYRVDGKVLPVAERHFNHWNTDPWQLDYHGGGHTLASGTVFLLPYYMGLYHGFIGASAP